MAEQKKNEKRLDKYQDLANICNNNNISGGSFRGSGTVRKVFGNAGSREEDGGQSTILCSTGACKFTEKGAGYLRSGVLTEFQHGTG